MARSRNLKPGFFKNEDLAECSLGARLCFAGLWTLADREGRLEDRPKRIKGELFAFDSIEVEPLLVELDKHGFIQRYAVNGLGLIQILAFHKHQNPHHREPESELPPPPSPGLNADANTTKPEAHAGSDDAKASDKPEAGPGLDPPRVDLARGSSRVDSGYSDSGNLIPETRPPAGEASGTVTAFDLQAEGVNAQHAADWLRVRKAKKLPLTATAWAKFKASAAKVGMDPPQAVEHCAGLGWAGFYEEPKAAVKAPVSDVFAGAR